MYLEDYNENLNTSHVKVNRFLTPIYHVHYPYLNTSHVKVNLAIKLILAYSILFKYISC